MLVVTSCMGGGEIHRDREDIIPYQEQESELEESYSELEEASGEKASIIEEFIADQVERNSFRVAGLGLTVFTRDDIILEVLYGYKDISQGLAIDSETVFGWGSITKLLVYISAMQLYEQGQLDFHEDIFTYIPREDFQNIQYPTTMFHLINHRAGFDDMRSRDIWDYIFISFEEEALSLGDTLREISTLDCVIQSTYPDEQVQYSNYGIALAGYIIEQISGMAFYEYVHQNIFAPLGIDSTALLPDLSDNNWVDTQRDRVQIYQDFEGRLVGERYQITIYPSGGATGTVGDIVRLGQGLLPDENGASPLFARVETMMELYPAPDDILGLPKDSLTGFTYYNGFAILLGANESNRILGQRGSTNGFTTHLIMDIDQGVGVAIAENSLGRVSLQWAEGFLDELLMLIFEN